MNIAVDKPKELAAFGNGSKPLSFSIIFHDSAGPQIVIPNFRVIDGCIKAPAGGKQFFPYFYCSEDMAGKIYDALKDNEHEWLVKAKLSPLAPKDIAIQHLVLNRNVAWKVAPSLIQDDVDDV